MSMCNYSNIRVAKSNGSYVYAASVFTLIVFIIPIHEEDVELRGLSSIVHPFCERVILM